MALNKIGIDSINWLGDPKVVMISLIIYTIWVDVGYNVILFRQVLTNLLMCMRRQIWTERANG